MLPRGKASTVGKWRGRGRSKGISALLYWRWAGMWAGPCLFSDGWANSTINTDSLSVVTSARTSVACMDLCHSTAAFGLDCWAAEWTAASSNCTLRMSDRPFNNSSLNFSMGTTVFLATCHVGEGSDSSSCSLKVDSSLISLHFKNKRHFNFELIINHNTFWEQTF